MMSDLDDLLATFYPEETAEIRKKLADLRIQAIMFDMDIDLEAFSLKPKKEEERPTWFSRYMERFHYADNLPEDPEQNWDEELEI